MKFSDPPGRPGALVDGHSVKLFVFGAHPALKDAAAATGREFVLTRTLEDFCVPRSFAFREMSMLDFRGDHFFGEGGAFLR